MRFSIIIPVHNAQATLKKCLDSIFNLDKGDFEVIVVDDKSTDKSKTIAEEYPCKIITLEKNAGAASARNTGKDNSAGEVIVFIDADVILKKDALQVIDEDFKKYKDIVAITGLLSDECPYDGFFSQYKNLYMNFIFRKCQKYIEFLYGSIIAIKREDYLKFDKNIKCTDDTELGQRYKELGKKILLEQKLEVVHLKEYDFFSIIRNDFLVPFWWTKSFIMHRGYEDIYQKRRFSHAKMDQIMSILISFLFIAALPFIQHTWAKIASITLAILFFYLNAKFFAFIYRKKGLTFMMKSIAFTSLDMIIMGCGIIAGFIYHAKTSKNKPKR
ncbi:MAG: glycosyltransferase family 2 protein [Candidatus Altiarchaeota archaeon]|nr:glycosyltransferase family 2 protein [Candidatus Altiarchaeota archaeon]